MRKRYRIDPQEERLDQDIAWFIDTVCPNRERIVGTSTLLRPTDTFIAVEHRVPVDYGQSFPRLAFFTTGLGSVQLRYIRQMSDEKTEMPADVRQVLRHAKTRIVTDRPENLVYVSAKEAVLLSSWDYPITVWAPAGRSTFWARAQDMQPITTLRAIHRDSTE